MRYGQKSNYSVQCMEQGCYDDQSHLIILTSTGMEIGSSLLVLAFMDIQNAQDSDQVD